MCKSVKFLFILSISSIQVSLSQSLSFDSLSLSNNSSVKNTIKYFNDTLKTNLNLYNGIEHPGYFRTIKGSAYLGSEEMTEGRLNYDDVWYSVPMLYDLHAERVVIMHFNKFYKISLINEKVREFILHGHLFRNFPITESRQIAPNGLCEVLYEGDSISVYARKRKLLNERSTSQGLERDFVNSNQYYMKVEGAYHVVKSKGDMFALMGNKKKDVVAELRKKKIKFRKNTEEALITASKVYEKI